MFGWFTCLYPCSLWKEVKDYVGDMLKEIKMGDVQDFTNFVNAVIDEASFDNIMSYIDYAKQSPDAEIVFGGNGDKSVGYFVEPTVIRTTDPDVQEHGGGDLRSGYHDLCV